MIIKPWVKKDIFLIAFLALLISFYDIADAVLLDADNGEEGKANTLIGRGVIAADKQNNQLTGASKVPAYAPREIIVKLKHKESAGALYSMRYSSRVSTDKNILSNIIARYNLKNGIPAFKVLHQQLKARNISQQQMDEELDVITTNKASSKNSPKQPRQSVDLLSIYILDTDEDAQAVSNKLKQDPDVEYAQPNYIRKVQMIPDDPYYHSSGSWGQSYDDLWGIKKIRCEQSWDVSQGEGIVVAVIDTGVDYNHPDLWDNIYVNPAVVDDRNGDGKIGLNDLDVNGDHFIEPGEIIARINLPYIGAVGWDFVGHDADMPRPSNSPMDGHGHGTHVSGTIAAVGNNNIGVIGVAPKAKIMPIKGLDDYGNGYDWTLAECITYAADNGAKIINNSWGGRGRSGILTDAFHYAYSKGCLAIAAAGNSNADAFDFTPANIDTVLAVAAIDPYDNKASFSNYGLNVPVSAPGVDVLSLRATGTDMYGDGTHIVRDIYYRSNGTSMACPHVAGLAALIASRYPQYNNDQIGWLIKNSVDVSPQPAPIFPPGFGVINTFSSLANPVIPPRLHAAINIGQIDYDLNNIPISYDIGGEDLWQYTIQYREERDADWHNLVGPSSMPGHSEYLWNLSGISDGRYIMRLSAITNDLREEISYASISLNRAGYYIIQPEVIFRVFRYGGNEMSNVNTSENVQGLYRLDDSVPFVGKAMGDYHLEWKKADDPGPWRSDYFTYAPDSKYLGLWDTSAIEEEGLYQVRLVDQAGVERYTFVELDRHLKTGYPLTLSPFNDQGLFDSSKLFSRYVNIDSDPQLEIVSFRTFCYPAGIYIFEHDGTLKKSWRIDNEAGNSAFPALGDIDGDGALDIVFTTCRIASPNPLTIQETLYCYKTDGTLIFKRLLPITDASTAYMRDPVIIADLNKDGHNEIIYRHDTAVCILDGQGNDAAPWPKPMQVGYPMTVGDEDHMAVGNFDGDPDLELAIVQNEGFVNNQSPGHVNIHVFNMDGSYAQGWPQTIENCYMLPSMLCGDMDGDGLDDIVIVTAHDIGYNYFSDMSIIGLKSDGSLLFTNYALNYYRIFKGLLADLDGNPGCEAIFDNQGKIEAFDYLGHSFNNWPFFQPYPYPYLAVDIDGDNKVEVVGRRVQETIPQSTFNLLILSADGNSETSNHFYNMITPYTGSAAMHYYDIDADGNGELIIEGNLPVYHKGTNMFWHYRPCILAYDTEAAFNPNLAQWPTPHHDERNTNRWNALPNDIISIELNELIWSIDGIRLGEKRSNLNNLGIPVHAVKNCGGVPVKVGIRYVPPADDALILPGLVQGLNTFITIVKGAILPVLGETVLADTIKPGTSASLDLTFGAPTALSQAASGMTAAYEIRAYKSSE
jgi:subtilisin family serine protease